MASFVALNARGAAALSGEVTGQRTAGFILFTPFVLVAASVLCVAFAVSTLRQWKTYVASTTPEERAERYAQSVSSNPSGRMFLLGGVALAVSIAGFAYLLIGRPLISSKPGGFALFLVALGLFSAAAFAALSAGFRWRRAQRRAAGG